MAEKQPPKLEHPNAALLKSATKGFEYLFSNDLAGSREHFAKADDPFHLMGLGVCAFLEAALGMETALMAEASKCLSESEAGTRRQQKMTKPRDIQYVSRFPYGLEWEILNADAVVLLGMTHALGESYVGYVQCMYALNNAHSKFGKLYKTVFPNGLPSSEPISPRKSAHLKSVSHQPSISSLASAASVKSTSTTTPKAPVASGGGSFFSRWMGSSAVASTPILPHEMGAAEDGPVEDLIVAGTAFGFGLFNLVFSLLPKKVQGVVGFFGFKSDRKLGLEALALSATKDDVHSVFAGLILMTYQGVVLLLSGYQADEQRLLREYKAIVDKIESKYPEGALWILNRAKIMRMAYDAEGAIKVLQSGLTPDRPHSFVQADMLLTFELAWTLLSQRRYQEAADTFLKITELNSWSHGTYYFIAGGCYISLGNIAKAQELLDAIPELIEKKKMTGKDLPTEVFIKKKLAFYQEKQARRGGDPKKWAECIKISPAEEIGIFWNNHSRISKTIAQQHVDELSKLTPLPPTTTPVSPTASFKTVKSPILSGLASMSIRRSGSTDSTRPASTAADLDTPDEIAIRALILGVNYRVLGQWELSRQFLQEAFALQDKIGVSTWVGGVAMFDLAVLELKEMEAKSGGGASVSLSSTLSSSSSASSSSASSPSLSVTIDNGDGDEDVKVEVEEKKKLTPELKAQWGEVLNKASGMLDTALGLAGSHIDLSSRLDSRIAMLRDEIAAKAVMVGVSLK